VKKIVYRPMAETDAGEAFSWYEQQRVGLGREFLDELRRAENSIAMMPLAYQIVKREARRCMLHRFPYQLIYRLVGEQVVVLACFHGRRSPKRSDSRL